MTQIMRIFYENLYFFGHADAPQDIEEKLRKVIIKLITYDGIDSFNVGVEGNFDRLCYKVLKDLQLKYNNIRIYRVLAYMPKNDNISQDSIFPENIEKVPKRVAIAWRNKWMINTSEYAVTYVKRIVGGAYKFESLAKSKGLCVINIVETDEH